MLQLRVRYNYKAAIRFSPSFRRTPESILLYGQLLQLRVVGISKFHRNTVRVCIVYLLFNLAYALSSVPAGMAADRFGRKRVILIGFLLFAAVYYGFAVAGSAQAVWLLFALYGIFMGLTEGIQKAFLATIIPADFKATAFGVYATCTGVAIFPASLIGGWLWEAVSPAATFYFGAATAAASALLFLLLIAVMDRSEKA